jgi:quinol monooxygenase YgiN
MTWGNMGTVKALPGRREELIALLVRSKPELRDAGCLVYEVGRNDADPDRVYVLEVWTSAAAHRASLGLGSVRDALQEAMPLLDGEMVSFTFEIAGSPLHG